MLRYAFAAACCLSAFAQTAAPPAFEVASLKPTVHGRVNGVSHSSIDIPTPQRLRVFDVTGLTGEFDFTFRY